MTITINTAPVGKGYNWIADSMGYFTRNPVEWIVSTVVIFFIMIVIGVIPFGGFLVYIFSPVFVGGFMLGCHAHAQGGSFKFQHAFAGFQADYMKRLIILGVYYAIANLILLIVVSVAIVVALGGMDFFLQLENMAAEDLLQFQQQIILICLITAALMLPIVMAMWFAPVLIVTTDVSITESMLLSFKACLRNVSAFTLYGLIALVLCVLAMIPFFLGFLLLLPVLMASVYVSYLDCFNIDNNHQENVVEPVS